MMKKKGDRAHRKGNVCPTCETKIEHGLVVNNGNAPLPAIGICFSCGEILYTDIDLSIRPLTSYEKVVAMTCQPEVWAEVQDIVAGIKKRNEGEQDA